ASRWSSAAIGCARTSTHLWKRRRELDRPPVTLRRSLEIRQRASDRRAERPLPADHRTKLAELAAQLQDTGLRPLVNLPQPLDGLGPVRRPPFGPCRTAARAPSPLEAVSTSRPSDGASFRHARATVACARSP